MPGFQNLQHVGFEDVTVASHAELAPYLPENLLHTAHSTFIGLPLKTVQNMANSSTEDQVFYPRQRQWIGDRLDHFVFTAFDGSQFHVTHKILERQDQEPIEESMEREAVAIYE